MRIEVLDDAKDDLVGASAFTRRRRSDSASTFSTPSSPTSIRFCSTQVFIESSMAPIALSRVVSLLQFTTAWKTKLFVSERSLTVAAIPHWFGVGSKIRAGERIPGDS